MKTSHLATTLVTFTTCLMTLLTPTIAQSEGHGAVAHRLTADITPPPPCHANPNAVRDIVSVFKRGDVRQLPQPLAERLAILAGRPHSQLPTQAFAEASFDKAPNKPKPSQLFQYYLLDTTGFEANPFTSLIPGVNDTAMLTATGPDCGLPTLGAVRLVLEPKPDLPTDPNDARRSSTSSPTSPGCSSSTTRAAGTRGG